MDDYDVSIETPAPTSASAGGVITIGRKKYAANLYWQPSPSGRVSQAAREAAAQPGQMADFYAVRPGTSYGRVPQFALGQRELGHRPGQPSAAASLAEDQPGSWGGVFPLPEGYWLIVSRDDLIPPDGDVLFADENEAKQRLYDEINLGGLQRIYAPENWAVPGGDPVPLTLLLQGRADYKLQYVKYPIKQLALSLLLIGGLAYGGYFAMTYQQEQLSDFEKSIQDMSPEQQALARLQQQQLLAPPPPPPPPKRVWEDEPSPLQFIEACHQTMMTIPATALGWKIGDVSCDGHTVTVNWTRRDGAAVAPPNAQVTGLKDETVSSYTIPASQARGPQELWESGALLKEAMLNNWPIEMTAIVETPAPPTPAAPGAAPAPPPPPPPWIKKKITLSSDNAPWYTWDRYNNIQGLVLDRLIRSGTGWKTEGTFYEKR